MNKIALSLLLLAVLVVVDAKVPAANSTRSNQIAPGCNPLSCGDIQNIVQNWFPQQYWNDFICIAYYESSWCPDAWNGGCCYGLFQISNLNLGMSGCPGDVQSLYDPNVNAQCAVAVLNAQGLNAWQTWSEGDCNNWSQCTV
eukprot:TRINITY_DN22080_c0_g1_i1.p1 TRINITY_DN22080_c0_g1~~TRINITY_DN22080_c0_g1_i1.p1  ORF type:complete len:142 (-),score=14.15 TRINITY_DN22080_c0_g1_i1:187-612(-)